MPGAEDSYGEHYDRVMREAFGERRIHIVTERVPARSIKIGDYVMYLPLEITEGANIDPQMAQVLTVTPQGEMLNINTTLGMMYLRRTEAIQVVA
jgi:hypothetical protein